jgi:hypothetical protein
VGDILIDRKEPETIFRHVSPILSSAEVAFANLEQTYSEKGYLIRAAKGHPAREALEMMRKVTGKK